MIMLSDAFSPGPAVTMPIPDNVNFAGGVTLTVILHVAFFVESAVLVTVIVADALEFPVLSTVTLPDEDTLA